MNCIHISIYAKLILITNNINGNYFIQYYIEWYNFFNYFILIYMNKRWLIINLIDFFLLNNLSVFY
ncbi:hypothetical protein XNW1_3520010 [Xenorhabdus nematophila str. Websteri]|nr:hypothetical protein XNW1_3520010 [Xenorhabdus nematophila str. Websteri]